MVTLEINGRFDEYKCRYVQGGWTYAEVVVYKKTTEKWMFGLFSTTVYKQVWIRSSGFVVMNQAKLFTPAQMIEWYQRAVDEYEKHWEAWSNVTEIGHGCGEL